MDLDSKEKINFYNSLILYTKKKYFSNTFNVWIAELNLHQLLTFNVLSWYNDAATRARCNLTTLSWKQK